MRSSVLSLCFSQVWYMHGLLCPNQSGASRPDWTAAQLSMTFTMVMAFFCIGCLIAGMMAKKVSPKIYIILSGILFLAGFMLASTTGASPATLYLGFGILCGLGAGFAYNAVMSTMSLWFPDKQGLFPVFS